MLNLSLKELQVIEKNRDIKGLQHLNMSKDKLLSTLGASEPQKNKTGIKQRYKKKKINTGEILGDIKLPSESTQKIELLRI